LKPNPKNPRLHTEKQVRQIAKTIEIFGFKAPVLIDHDARVIAGHGKTVKILLTRRPLCRLAHGACGQLTIDVAAGRTAVR
jgi:hypothetical protein